MKPEHILVLFLSFLFLYTCEDIDTTPPTVSVSSHSSGQTVNEFVTIKVNTNDNEGIKKVEFYINDELVLTLYESPFEYLWDTTELEDGEYIIKIISYDTSDNSTESQPIMLKVDNSLSFPKKINILSIDYNLAVMTIVWSKSEEFDFEETFFSISWTFCPDEDFKSYELHVSLDDFENDDRIIFNTNSVNDTSFNFTPSNQEFLNFYIKVLDIWGLESVSNIDFGSPYPTSIMYTNGQITKCDEYGYNRREITHGGIHSYFNISPDKSLVIFMIDDIYVPFVDSGLHTYDIGVVSIDGNYWTTLTELGPSQNKFPLFTPNGQNIIYTSNKTGVWGIYIMNTDGSNARNLIYVEHVDSPIIISSSGKYISFLFYNRVYLMNSDGSEIKQVSENGKHCHSSLRFSPDESILLYNVDNVGFGVYDINKGKTSSLQGSNTYIELPDQSRYKLEFFPNENSILYTSGNYPKLYKLNLDNNNVQLMSDKPNIQGIDISPDGNNILFKNAGGLWLMNSDGNGLRNLNNTDYSSGSPKFIRSLND